MQKVKGTTIGMFLALLSVNAQENHKTLPELIHLATENNAGLMAGHLEMKRADAFIGSAFSFDKTRIYFEYDQNNLAINNEPLDVLGVSQDFLFPTVYFVGKRVNKERYNLSISSYEVQKKALERAVTAMYYEYQYARDKEYIYRQLDSLYANFASKAARRYELGATTYLEKITAQSKRRQISVQFEKAQKDVSIAHSGLSKLVQAEEQVEIAVVPSFKLPVQDNPISGLPEVDFYDRRISLAHALRSFEQQKLLPDISLNYFQGTNSQLDNNLYGYQVGLKIPLFFNGQSSHIRASKIAADIAAEESKEYKIQLAARLRELQTELIKYEKALTYYQEEGTVLSREILRTANGSFKNGEIDFYQYILSLENAYQIQLDYLEDLHLYNQTVIKINYITF